MTATMATLPPILFLLGALIWLISVYWRTEHSELRRDWAIQVHGFLPAMLATSAIGLYGMNFLRSPAPDWIGYLFLAGAATFATGLLLRRLPPGLVYLPIVIAGFTFLIS